MGNLNKIKLAAAFLVGTAAINGSDQNRAQAAPVTNFDYGEDVEVMYETFVIADPSGMPSANLLDVGSTVTFKTIFNTDELHPSENQGGNNTSFRNQDSAALDMRTPGIPTNILSTEDELRGDIRFVSLGANNAALFFSGLGVNTFTGQGAYEDSNGLNRYITLDLRGTVDEPITNINALATFNDLAQNPDNFVINFTAGVLNGLPFNTYSNTGTLSVSRASVTDPSAVPEPHTVFAMALLTLFAMGYTIKKRNDGQFHFASPAKTLQNEPNNAYTPS